MRETLGDAVLALFEGQQPSTPAAGQEQVAAPTPEAPNASNASGQTATNATPPATEDVGQLARLASDHYQAAQEALRRGDWTAYGRELDQMDAALQALVNLTSQQ